MIEEAVTDERLLLDARTDPDAFTRFYRRHATALLGYLVRRTGDPELGADLTAETFACALEGIERFEPERGSGVNLYSLDGSRVPWAGPKDRLERSYAPLDLGS